MRKSILFLFLSIFNQIANWLILDFRSFFSIDEQCDGDFENMKRENRKTRLFRQRVKFIWGKHSWKDETFPRKKKWKDARRWVDGERDCWIIQKPRILKAKHSPWTEYVSRFKSARGKEEWNGENKAMRAKWREFEDSPSWDSEAKLSILFRGNLYDIVIRAVVSLYQEKVKKKCHRLRLSLFNVQIR